MQKYEQTIVYCDLNELKVKSMSMKRGYVRLHLIKQAIGNIVIILHLCYCLINSGLINFNTREVSLNSQEKGMLFYNFI